MEKLGLDPPQVAIVADATPGSIRLAPASRPHTPRKHKNRLITPLPSIIQAERTG